MSDRLIRLPEVEADSGFRKSKIYGLIQAGEFPAPIKVGRSSLWIESQVLSWVDAQIAARDQRPQEGA